MYKVITYFLSCVLFVLVCQHTKRRIRPGWGWENWSPSSSKYCLIVSSDNIDGFWNPFVPINTITWTRFPEDLAIIFSVLISWLNTCIASLNSRPWRFIRGSCAHHSWFWTSWISEFLKRLEGQPFQGKRQYAKRGLNNICRNAHIPSKYQKKNIIKKEANLCLKMFSLTLSLVVFNCKISLGKASLSKKNAALAC